MLLGRDRFCIRKRRSSPWSLAAHASVKLDPAKEQGGSSEQLTSIRDMAWPQIWPCPMQQCRTVAGHCHTPSLCWVPGKLTLSVPAHKGSEGRQSTTHLLGC